LGTVKKAEPAPKRKYRFTRIPGRSIKSVPAPMPVYTAPVTSSPTALELEDEEEFPEFAYDMTIVKTKSSKGKKRKNFTRLA